VSDPAGNIKIEKDRSNRRSPYRIDPAVALAMAVGLQAKFEPVPPKPTLSGFLSNPVMIL
jgi:phage terminase large subunit-like protein